MTPDELRALAGEATPGPWAFRGERLDRMIVGPPPRHIIVADPCVYNPQDERLALLAPQLALLCAEMGEALELLWTHYLLPMSIAKREQIVSALARLEALEKP